MSDIEHITWIELGEKLEAIVAHCKQRLPGEWPITLDDKFVELMNDACQYFPYEIASTKVLSSSNAPTTTPKNPLASEVERLKTELSKAQEKIKQLEKEKAELLSTYKNYVTICNQQSEDKVELLEVLKDIRDIAEGEWHWGNKRIMEIADQVYTKHSAKDSGGKE